MGELRQAVRLLDSSPPAAGRQLGMGKSRGCDRWPSCWSVAVGMVIDAHPTPPPASRHNVNSLLHQHLYLLYHPLIVRSPLSIAYMRTVPGRTLGGVGTLVGRGASFRHGSEHHTSIHQCINTSIRQGRASRWRRVPCTPARVPCCDLRRLHARTIFRWWPLKSPLRGGGRVGPCLRNWLRHVRLRTGNPGDALTPTARPEGNEAACKCYLVW